MKKLNVLCLAIIVPTIFTAFFIHNYPKILSFLKSTKLYPQLAFGTNLFSSVVLSIFILKGKRISFTKAALIVFATMKFCLAIGFIHRLIRDPLPYYVEKFTILSVLSVFRIENYVLLLVISLISYEFYKSLRKNNEDKIILCRNEKSLLKRCNYFFHISVTSVVVFKFFSGLLWKINDPSNIKVLNYLEVGVISLVFLVCMFGTYLSVLNNKKKHIFAYANMCFLGAIKFVIFSKIFIFDFEFSREYFGFGFIFEIIEQILLFVSMILFIW